MMWPGIAPSTSTSLARSMSTESTEPGPTEPGSSDSDQLTDPAELTNPWQQEISLAGLTTERADPSTADIDTLSTLELVGRINREDAKVAGAVGSQAEAIAQAIDAIAARMRQGGRLIYVGAGTSGRLGILDAVECPPTFGTSPNQVIGVIAGGSRAIIRSIEGAEDDPDAGSEAVIQLKVGIRDAVVGIAASGRTPYVIGAMRQARQAGSLVISLACNHPSPIAALADIVIAPVVGPEVIAGSTRLKAGTAQKMVLNLLSTGAMIRLGKTYGHWMVDVQATNAKLQQRAQRIVASVCHLDPDAASDLLRACGGEVKTALVAHLARLSPQQARIRLHHTVGSVRQALALKTQGIL